MHGSRNEAINTQRLSSLQDLQTMSDFDIHKTCETYRCIEHLALGNHLLCDSGSKDYHTLSEDFGPLTSQRYDVSRFPYQESSSFWTIFYHR